MKKFAAFLMILSLSVFAVGCGGKTKTGDAAKTGDDKTKTEATDAGHDDAEKTKTEATEMP